MSRFRYLLAIAVVASLAFASLALAATSKVTGGTTQITASDAAAKLLADNHITVAPIDPATASGATFTFPIAGGRLNVKTLHGVIRHKGGLTLSGGTSSVSLLDPTLVSDKHGVSLWAVVRGKAHRFCRNVGLHRAHVRCLTIVESAVAKIARVTDVKLSGGKATGTVELTAASAGAVNRLAGKKVVHAGDVLGTGVVAPTLRLL